MVVCFLAMELQESWAELESIQDEERWATASTKMEKQADEEPSGWKGVTEAGGSVKVCQIMTDTEKSK